MANEDPLRLPSIKPQLIDISGHWEERSGRAAGGGRQRRQDQSSQIYYWVDPSEGLLLHGSRPDVGHRVTMKGGDVTDRFSELVIEGDDGAQWLLDAPTTGGPGFTFGFYSVGERRDVEVATTTVLKPGVPRELSWTQTMEPVVTQEVRDLIDSITPGAVQWIPLEIEGHPHPPRFLMNILHLVDCVDTERSIGKMYPVGHEREGRWSSLSVLHVKPGLAPELDIFRVQGFSGTIVVSARFKEAMESAGVKSIRYKSLD